MTLWSRTDALPKVFLASSAPPSVHTYENVLSGTMGSHNDHKNSLLTTLGVAKIDQVSAAAPAERQ